MSILNIVAATLVILILATCAALVFGMRSAQAGGLVPVRAGVPPSLAAPGHGDATRRGTASH